MTLTRETRLPSIEQLPSVFAIDLDGTGAISLSGEEQNKYLQGQVTCDVNSANENSLLNGAHCDAKGKVFSAFRFILRDGKNLLIQPKSTVSASLAELKKFGVFAKVDITEATDLAYVAICGADAQSTLMSQYSVLPTHISPVEQSGSTTLVFIDGNTPRYLLIDKSSVLEQTNDKMNITVYPHDVWNLLEITEGYPVLSNEGVSTYVPQMLNLQATNAISFTKGCYLGQETVARMQYLGKNKRALFSLKGSIDSESPGQLIIEKQLGENWRKAGDTLVSYKSDDGEVYIQAVLSSDTDSETSLRIQGSTNSILNIQPLPYSLAVQE
jgi:folate-binding protein YgfZ